MGMFDVVINTPVKYTRVCKKEEENLFRRSDPALYELFMKEDIRLADVIRILKTGDGTRTIRRLKANDWAKIMDVNPNYVVVTKSTELRSKQLIEEGVSLMHLSDRPLLVLVKDLSEIDTELFKIYGYFSLK